MKNCLYVVIVLVPSLTLCMEQEGQRYLVKALKSPDTPVLRIETATTQETAKGESASGQSAQKTRALSGFNASRYSLTKALCAEMAKE